MALIHADSFSIYGSNNDLMLNGVYAQLSRYGLLNDPDGVSPGKVLCTIVRSVANQEPFRYVLPNSRLTVGVACRVWLSRLPDYTGQNSIWEIRDQGNNTLACICVDPTGRLVLRTGINYYGGSATIGQTDTPVLTPNGWYHMEVKATQGGAGLSGIEVRIEGLTVFQSSALTFRNTNPIAQVGVSEYSQGNNMPRYYMKDYVVWDTEGSRNNDWMGSVLVVNLNPEADVDLNWTPSTGTTGFDILNNIPPVDGQYLAAPYSETAPNFPEPYVGSLSDLPTETTSVRGVITYARAGKSDGGDGFFQVGLISNPTEGAPATVLGQNRPITVAQTYWRDVFETDPATTGLWTPEAVNRINIQLNRTA